MNRDSAINLLLRLPSAVRMRVRIRLWRALGARIGARCWVQDVQLPANPWNIELDEGVMLDKGVVLLTSNERGAQPKIRLGRNVYINRYTMLDASEQIHIGDCTMIGPHCYLTDHDHGTEAGLLVGDQASVSAPLTIGSNVWIGAGVMLLKGVTVGDNAVIGAGSVVTRDVAANTRVAGVPARLLKPSEPLPTSPANAPTRLINAASALDKAQVASRTGQFIGADESAAEAEPSRGDGVVS